MYTKVHDHIWKSFRRKNLSDNGKMLFIYLCTCTHRNILGFFYMPFAYIQADLDWTLERVSKGYEELYQNGLCRYDTDRELILINGFLEHNPFDNQNVEKKAVKVFDKSSDIQESPLLCDFETVLRGLGKPFDLLLERVTHTLSNTETEEETEEETEDILHGEITPSMPDEKKSKLFLEIILNDKSMHPVFEDQITKWQELYPAVDVIQELRNMVGWCDSNPTKRKTKSGIARFITGWLAREQNRGGNVKASHPPSTKPKDYSKGEDFLDYVGAGEAHAT